jgi:hypothetical protein
MGRESGRFGWGVAGVASILAVLVAGGADADDPCREWRLEHRDWKARALQRYLLGAPQRAVDEAVFELLQREAYLTSCDVPVQGARDALVGWRLVGRLPEDYGSAVVESVLEGAGFDVGLRDLLAPTPAPVAAAPELRPGPRRVRPR